MRQKTQHKRRMNLLKKTNFFQYLRQYPSSIDNSPTINQEYQNTTTLFLPIVREPRLSPCIDQQNKQEKSIRYKSSGDKIKTTENVNQFSSNETKMPRFGMKESQRFNNKFKLLNVGEVVAKSVSFSNRLERKSFLRDRLEKKIKTIEEPSKIVEIDRVTIQSPLKRTFMTKGWKQRQNIFRPPKIDISMVRKPSICGWEYSPSPF